MTSGPDPSEPEPTQPYGGYPPPPPPPMQAPPMQTAPMQPAPMQPAPAMAYAAPGPVGAYGVSPQTPYGVHPVTGVPYSDKSKLVAGLLQIFLPFGVGRFYIGDTTIGVIQLIVTLFTCGIGGLWGVVDGIVMLATDSKDKNGYLLRNN